VRLASFDYDARNRLIEARDPMGHISTYEYNDADLMVRKTDPGGSSFYYEYDDDQRCIKNHGDNGKYLRRFAYNPDENETIVTNGLGHSRTYYYKYTGLVEYALDELGHSYLQLHDENGFLISVIDKNKRINNYENDEQGRIRERSDATNKRWRTYYHGCRTIHKDPLGNAIFAVRDRGGRLLQHQDQDGNRIEYQPKEIQSHFDAWNRLVATSDPLGNYHLYAYDNNGRLVSALDPRGYSTRLRYDPQGNLAAVTDPEGFEQRFVYQGNRELVEQIDAKNNAVRFAYDCEGRMTQITNPSGDTHTFAYDRRGLLSEETSFDQQKSKYTYDPAGNLINVQRADAIYHIEYDVVYQPIRITATDGGIKHSIEYTYDAGRLIRAENKHGHVALSYDSLGRVIREEQNDYTIANAYDAAGNLFMTRDGFGHLMEFDYSADNRLESVTIEDQKYIRIVRDAAGRPTEYHLPGAIASHCAYDPNGNLAKQATHKQCENNLRMINKRIYSRNTYDALGRRILKKSGAKETRYYWDQYMASMSSCAKIGIPWWAVPTLQRSACIAG
jgi:YD repeat-containing protein